MAPVNAYWIPPQWICASITVMEICTIFIPCYVAARHGTLHAETLAAIRTWEEQKALASSSLQSSSSSNASTSAGSGGAASEKGTFATTLVGSVSEADLIGGSSDRRKSTFSYAETLKFKPSSTTRRSRTTTTSSINTIHYPPVMFTLDSLNQCLRLNPTPLQTFAAHRDFSGENVAFLTAVADWKRAWAVQRQLKSAALSAADREAQRRRFFNEALRIYAGSVSFAYAAFPVNLAWRERKALEGVFEGACCVLFGRRGSWESVDSAWSGGAPEKNAVTAAAAAEQQGQQEGVGGDASLHAEDEDGLRAWYYGAFPDGFELSVFDAAESSVKQLVLLDTWPKFVRSGWAEEEAAREKKEKRKSGFGGRVFGGARQKKRRWMRDGDGDGVSVV